jgi:hypothetical protein
MPRPQAPASLSALRSLVEMHPDRDGTTLVHWGSLHEVVEYIQHLELLLHLDSDLEA